MDARDMKENRWARASLPCGYPRPPCTERRFAGRDSLRRQARRQADVDD